MPREIRNLDPLLVRGINQRYLLFNLHRGLFYYNKENKLKAHGAKACRNKKNKLQWSCRLNQLKYHNKKDIKAKDYINTFKLIWSNQEESFEGLKNIKSLKEKNEYELEFTLHKEDKDFLHNLTDINLSPRPKEKLYAFKDDALLFSGPYFVSKINESKALLKANKNFKSSSLNRPDVKVLFIDDATTALNLYETGRLNFLRHLDTSYYKSYKDEAFLSPHLKLDGLFLSPDIPLKIRGSIFESLDYEELKKIFNSKGRPGCLQLNGFNFTTNKIDCFSLKKSKVKFSNEKKRTLSVPSISQRDHVKMAEWVKMQLKKNLDLHIEIEQLESKIFYSKANAGELEFYRRSVPLKQLTCSHAKTELLRLPEFQSLALDFNLECDLFFKKALKSYIWIPLGLVHLIHLHNNSFEGYYINALDQFGLEDLRKK